MEAGKLDRRITLRTFTTSQDTLGFQEPTYRDLATVWARKRELGGQEKLTADQVLATAMVEFTIRYRTDVSTEHKIVCEGKTYQIRSIREGARRREETIILAELIGAP